MSEPVADEQVTGFRRFRTSPRYAAIWNAVTAYLVFYVVISPFGRQPGVVHAMAALGAVALLAGGLLAPKAALGSYRRFRAFRRTRPFYAAIFIAVGGLILFYLTKSPPKYLPHVGVGGIYGMGAGIALWLIALLVLLLPSQRYVGGAIAVVLGVVSFPLSNLGGFFVGMFFSVLGGSMAFGWMPQKPEKKRRWFRKIQAPAGAGGIETGVGV
ncbi:DUF6114 domain-containing protein [Catenulispora subtropica]|uniref:Integral membrane protein n=1 Tax=Catenulispora subtropica TaxID=450798 RepID=A0ABN2RHG0_9ACTN